MALSLAKKCESDIDYSTDNIILFTWNPNDRKVGTDENHEMKWDTMVAKHLKQLTRVARKFCIVAELSPTGRLHCHGWFSLDDKIKWVKSVRPHFQMNGNLRESKMRSTKAFYYYKEDIDETKQALSEDYIVFCHRNHKIMLADIKQKYYTKAIEEKPQEVRRMNILDFMGFKDDPK